VFCGSGGLDRQDAPDSSRTLANIAKSLCRAAEQMTNPVVHVTGSAEPAEEPLRVRRDDRGVVAPPSQTDLGEMSVIADPEGAGFSVSKVSGR
jgi:hypothetical protein